MGYVPPTKNEVAVHYGNRDVKSSSSIQKIRPISPVKWHSIKRSERHGVLSRQEAYESLYNRRKRIEKEIEGKGNKVDTIA